MAHSSSRSTHSSNQSQARYNLPGSFKHGHPWADDKRSFERALNERLNMYGGTSRSRSTRTTNTDSRWTPSPEPSFSSYTATSPRGYSSNADTYHSPYHPGSGGATSAFRLPLDGMVDDKYDYRSSGWQDQSASPAPSLTRPSVVSGVRSPSHSQRGGQTPFSTPRHQSGDGQLVLLNRNSVPPLTRIRTPSTGLPSQSSYTRGSYYERDDDTLSTVTRTSDVSGSTLSHSSSDYRSPQYSPTDTMSSLESSPTASSVTAGGWESARGSSYTMSDNGTVTGNISPYVSRSAVAITSTQRGIAYQYRLDDGQNRIRVEGVRLDDDGYETLSDSSSGSDDSFSDEFASDDDLSDDYFSDEGYSDDEGYSSDGFSY